MTTLPLFGSDGNIPEKKCTKCGRMLPASNEFFAKSTTVKSGLTSVCKDCNNRAWRLKHPAAKERGKHSSQVNVPEGHRRCTLCKNIFPATPQFFNRNKRVKAGLYWQCKTCKRQEDTAYRNLPESKERRKEYEQTPEYKVRQRINKRMSSSTPEAKERVRRYQHRPEVHARIRETTRLRWHDPVKGINMHMLHRVHGHARRARQKAVLGMSTPQQIQDLLKRQKQKCYYCQTKFERRNGKYIYHVDHTFPLSRVAGTDIPANNISYLVLACPSCNCKKRDKFPWEFPEGGRLL